MESITEYALTLKVIGIIAGLIFMYFGYKLFINGIRADDSTITGEAKPYSITISKAAPGTVLAILGAIIILGSIFKNINRTTTKEKTALMLDSTSSKVSSTNYLGDSGSVVVKETDSVNLMINPKAAGIKQPRINPNSREKIKLIETGTSILYPPNVELYFHDKHSEPFLAMALTNAFADWCSAHDYFMLAIKLEEYDNTKDTIADRYRFEIQRSKNFCEGSGERLHVYYFFVGSRSEKNLDSIESFTLWNK